MLPLFRKFPHNIIQTFTKRSLAWFTVAIIITVVSVYSGFDWFYFTWLRETDFYQITFPAVILGAVVPIFGLAAYLIWGYFKDNEIHVRNAWAMGQGALAGYIISTILKVFTGRIPPPHVFFKGMADISHGFQFGFMRGGFFWGWPSSHTAVAFGMAGALIALYPKNKLVWFWALLYAFYIGLGVSVSIHWFSEFAAGAIIGLLLGISVGKSFRNWKFV